MRVRGKKTPDSEDSIQYLTTLSDLVPSQQHRKVNTLLLHSLFSENCFSLELLYYLLVAQFLGVWYHKRSGSLKVTNLFAAGKFRNKPESWKGAH